MADAEPNLDLGLDYTGGIAKPTVADKNSFARVAVDQFGDVNLEYVPGVERRVTLKTSVGPGTLTGSTTKTQIVAMVTLPANSFVGTSDNAASNRLKIRVLGELPARVGTKIGIDFGAVPADLTSVAALPAASNPFIYECVVYAALTNARSEAILHSSGQSPIINTSTFTVDTTQAMTVYLTAQLANAADSLVFRRAEAWLIG